MIRDEFFHPPGDDPLWNESHYFDFVEDDLQGHVRLGFYPNLGRASVWVYFLLDEQHQLGVHDEGVPAARTHGTCFRGSTWELDYRPGITDGEWEFRCVGSLDPTPVNAPLPLEGEGSVSVESQLTLSGRVDPFFYSEGHGLGDDGGRVMPGDADRYEQPVTVEGWVDVENKRRSVNARGERDHSWGPRDWFSMNWCWCSGSFEDGTAFNLTRLTDADSYLNGFWFDGSKAIPLTRAAVRMEPGFDAETARAWSRGDVEPSLSLQLGWDEGEATVAVRPFVTTPIRWRRCEHGAPMLVEDVTEASLLFNRAACRMDRDGVAGVGFLENGQQV